jgi:hypothetical protein
VTLRARFYSGRKSGIQKELHEFTNRIDSERPRRTESASGGWELQCEAKSGSVSFPSGAGMALIILLPALACLVVMAKGSLRSALINVYLPSVLLLPQYFELRFPHTPPLSFADAAIVPLGVALLATEMRRWRFDWMDLLVFLFAASAAVSEGLNTVLADGTWTRLFTSPAETLHADVNLGIFQFASGITTIVLPYMAGKLLIEQGEYKGQPVRKMFLKRMVTLLAVVAAISIFDFIGVRSVWQMVFRHFFPDQPLMWPIQIRWGFGRIQGPYAHAILAGMVFLMGLTYCIWLRNFSPRWGTRKIIKGLPLTVRGFILWAIVAGLLMTQSRGPWLGVALALLFVFLMQKFPVTKATAIFLVLIAVFSVAGYYYANKYTESGQGQSTKEEQASAIYRRDLIHNYKPVVMLRKAFGWGISNFPVMGGQPSIDNEYLLLAVTQGFTGLGLFLAILAGCGARLLLLATRPMAAEDRGLVFAHLAVLIGLMTTVATVYLGEQVMLLFFLIVGWVQGLNPSPVAVAGRTATARVFEFRRVLT